MDAVTTVMTDPATCGCGCGRPRPAPPAGGGLAPVYASRACQQRAYRRRQATRPAPTTAPVDPPAVAELVRDIRELAGVLDAGGTVPEGLTGAVRAGVRDLLARVSPTPPVSGPAEDQDRSSRDDRGSVPPPAAVAAPTRARQRQRRDRPVVVVNADTGLARELDETTSAAVRAVHGAGPGDVLALTRHGEGGGEWEVTLGGVRLGWVHRAQGPRGGRGWQAVSLQLTRGRTVHRARDSAATEVAADLARLADRARRATLRTT
ncbi:hypothetical protein [Candidatus Frankia nodulisporulans]|uniref:hypothetical protein n=1 Tax=Candidatus Frankia nodulisporulans TaxID=2060052 RepID=UPI0013CF88F2|nr:hypothetical protein [Candidatus Frankia nodulisporulans]